MAENNGTSNGKDQEIQTAKEEDDIVKQMSKVSINGPTKKDCMKDIEGLKAKLALASHNKTDSRTAIVYDLEMAAHRNIFLRNHPERPERVLVPMMLLEETRLLARLRTVGSRECTRDEALTVHSQEHWAFLEMLPGMSNRDLYKQGADLDSIYLSNESFRAAKLAAGCLLAITEEVLTDRAINGVAVIRPPGHHCRAEQPMGFCLLGNVPMACKFAINCYGVERILVVDWDVHHGNGTEDMFLDDERVLYTSLHRYDQGNFYPGTGHPTTVGTGSGAGYNLNVGWNESGKGDGDYLHAFHELILPLALEYQPQLVFISAGFDSGKNDPLGKCCVTPAGYGQMTRYLMGVCKGKVIVALEGGYNLETVSNGIRACTSVLLGDYPDLPDNAAPSTGGRKSIDFAMQNIAPFWSNLIPSSSSPVTPKESQEIEELGEEPDTEPESFFDPVDKIDLMANGHGRSRGNGYISQCQDLTAEDRLMAEMAESSNAKEIVEVSDSPQVFAVHPKTWCEHLEEHVKTAPLELAASPPCSVCQDSSESWYCLHCYQPFCSRYVNEHGLHHAIGHSHLMNLSMSDLSVWCYGCDSYVHNEVLLDAKNKGHIAKFGEPAVKIELASIAEISNRIQQD